VGDRNLSRFVWPGFFGLLALGWLALVVTALLNYPGNGFLFLLFVASYTLMAGLALPKPRLYGYTFLAAFLFLGFCAKSAAYLSLGIPLVEPTGAFDGSGHAWDSALAPAIAGSGAVIVIRLLHLINFRNQPKAASPLGLPPPAWYVRFRFPVLGASIAGLVALDVLNFFLALFQVGVAPGVILPAHLSAVVEWLFVAGLAMWAATLVGWEAQLSPARLGSILLIPLTEAFGSISTLSRSWYLFRATSYLLVAAEFPAFLRAHLARPWRAFFLVGLPVAFGVYLAGVSVLRIAVYPANYELPTSSNAPVLPEHGQITNAKLQIAARELSLLAVGRWIGIEGTMAVSSYPGVSTHFFESALREKPSIGEFALYQRLAGSYRTTNGFVFLTTPGAIAILDFSGSLPLVVVGMGLLTAVLIVFEIGTSRLLGNAFTVSIVAMSVANAIAQMQFPYLFVVFLIEQAVAVAGLALISRVVSRRRDARAPRPLST